MLKSKILPFLKDHFSILEVFSLKTLKQPYYLRKSASELHLLKEAVWEGGGTGWSFRSNCEEPPLDGKSAYPREALL